MSDAVVVIATKNASLGVMRPSSKTSNGVSSCGGRVVSTISGRFSGKATSGGVRWRRAGRRSRAARARRAERAESGGGDGGATGDDEPAAQAVAGTVGHADSL